MKTQITTLLPPALRPRTLLRRHLETVTRAGLVLDGPFAGLRYVDQSVGSMWWPKILGTYELELAATIGLLCAEQPAWIIDIGAAEGYYAIGMAWRCPQTRVIAFEGDHAGRKLQEELAVLNNVDDRLHIEGFCDASALRRALAVASGGLIICDIEGGELTLLNPEIAPDLVDDPWTLLVEIHDHVDPTIADTLIERFKDTHSIQEIVSRPRRAADLASGVRRNFLSRWVPAYLDERRPGPMRWLLLRPLA
ncbi:MAG: hypothetical protein H7Y06_11815 [Opitutaceae bacterium]|nr:hypothetical protein [Opitutaceae bacterium]